MQLQSISFYLVSSSLLFETAGSKYYNCKGHDWTCLIRIALSLPTHSQHKSINYKVSTQQWWPSEKRKITSSNSRWMEYVNNKDTPHHFWTSENISHPYENHIMLSSRTNTISIFLSFDPNIYYLVDQIDNQGCARAILLEHLQQDIANMTS